MKVRVSFLIGALLLWSLPVAAQVTTGRILGVIQDESQAVLPGGDRHAQRRVAAGRGADDGDGRVGVVSVHQPRAGRDLRSPGGVARVQYV